MNRSLEIIKLNKIKLFNFFYILGQEKCIFFLYLKSKEICNILVTYTKCN